jgi:hypothetical protein
MTCRTTREDTPIGGARARHRWTAFDKCAVSAAAMVRAHRRTRRNARAQRDRMFAVVPPISQTGMPNGYGPDHQRWPAKGLAPAHRWLAGVFQFRPGRRGGWPGIRGRR